MEPAAASEKIRRWLEVMADPMRDPWSDWSDDDDEEKEDCLDHDANVIDPTVNFTAKTDATDITTEDDIESGEEEQDCDSSGSGSSRETTSDGSSEYDRQTMKFRYSGGRDSEGLFHGGGHVTFTNGDEISADFVHGVRDGEGIVISARNDIARLCGNYVAGKLQGKGKVISTATSVLDCRFRDSVLHGRARRIDMKKFREFRRQLTFVGRYRSGRPAGPCWQYREGGGFLFGRQDSDGTFTGPNIAFIYPDLETAFVGRFEDSVMKKAAAARVVGIRLENGIMIPEFCRIDDGPLVGYSKSTKTSMGEHPLAPDPYESKHVVCRRSAVDAESAGEGLFARRAVPTGTVVAFYNGVRLPFVLGGPKEDWESSGYKIFVNADWTSGERMNIPEDMISVDRYCATLGHKMNHSFSPNCVEWFVDHPRFGLIPCEKTTRDVSEGEELFLDYEYDPYNCPNWFREALVAFVLDAKERNTADEEVPALNKKYWKFVELELGYKIQ